MQGPVAAVCLLPLLLLTAIPIILGSQAAPSSDDEILFKGLIFKSEKSIELSPTAKSALSNMSASPELQETLHKNELTPRISFSGGPYQPTECCFKFTTRVPPLGLIVTYYKTSSQCAKPGIIFITKKGFLICANPSDSWVQRYIKSLEEK